MISVALGRNEQIRIPAYPNAGQATPATRRLRSTPAPI